MKHNATASAKLTVTLLLALTACTSASTDNPTPNPPTTPRSTADRPDEVAGYQVHVMYVIPSDGADRQLDTNGQLARSITAGLNWLKLRTNGSTLRVDTYRNAIDVTFVRLSKTDAQIAASGVFVRDRVQEELIARGFNDPKKILAVYYDGSSAVACGGGAYPPTLVGTAAMLYLKGQPPGAPACDTNPIGADVNAPGYWEFSMLHEIVHTLGFVPSCGRNHGFSGHTTDDPRDLMYAGSQPWRPSLLDVNNDDYWKHDHANCPDLAKSVFLEPLPVGAQRPPGWN